MGVGGGGGGEVLFLAISSSYAKLHNNIRNLIDIGTAQVEQITFRFHILPCKDSLKVLL